MKGDRISELQEKYSEVLKNYLETHNEADLFSISKLSKEFLSEKVGPEEVAEMHTSSLNRIMEGMAQDEMFDVLQWAVNPLLELMMSYAMVYQEYLELHKKKLEQFEKGEQFVQAEKLAGIGVLSSGMLNEMSNLLSEIAVCAKAVDKNKDKHKEFSRLILQRTDRAMNILKAVIFYSRRMNNGKVTLVDLNEVVAESLEIVKRTINPNSILIKTDYKEVAKIHLNRGEMEIVFVNLITNAVDAIQGSGELTISTGLNVIKSHTLNFSRISYKGNAKKSKHVFGLPTGENSARFNIAKGIVGRQKGAIGVNKKEGVTSVIVRISVPDELEDFLRSVEK